MTVTSNPRLPADPVTPASLWFLPVRSMWGTDPVATARTNPRPTRLPGPTYLGRLHGHPSVLGEHRLALEYLRLRWTPVFRMEGVAPGRGLPVLLVPGLLLSDRWLHVLRDWLERAGYMASLPGIACNIDYSEAVLERLADRAAEMRQIHRRKVTVIGHSRGGMLGLVLARRRPDLVGRVIGLGSPLGAPFDVHPVTMAGVRVAQAFNAVRHARTARVEEGFLEELAAPPAVPTTSIYSRSDGIVYWEACLRDDVAAMEVEGSHLGLPLNHHVYRLLASLLAH